MSSGLSENVEDISTDDLTGSSLSDPQFAAAIALATRQQAINSKEQTSGKRSAEIGFISIQSTVFVVGNKRKRVLLSVCCNPVETINEVLPVRTTTPKRGVRAKQQ